jgi:hypothetical protein
MQINGSSSCEKADQRVSSEFSCRSTALFELRAVYTVYGVRRMQRRDRSGVKVVVLSAFSGLELVESCSTSQVLSSHVSFVTIGTASKIGHFLNFFAYYSPAK